MLKRKGSFGSLFYLCLILNSFAQEEMHFYGELEPLEEKSPIVEVIENEIPFPKIKLTTQDLRMVSRGTVMVGLNLLSTWIPYKKTISYTHIFSPKWSLEFEYAFGSLGVPVSGINIGGITEKNSSLIFRRYVGNSFHFIFGAYEGNNTASLGRGYSLGKFQVKNLGLTSGIANRWQWKNGLTFGIEWFRMNLPVINTLYDDGILKNVSNSKDRRDVKTVMDYFNRIPTFTLLGLNLGYTF
jgi:hypothetical protein